MREQSTHGPSNDLSPSLKSLASDSTATQYGSGRQHLHTLRTCRHIHALYTMVHTLQTPTSTLPTAAASFLNAPILVSNSLCSQVMSTVESTASTSMQSVKTVRDFESYMYSQRSTGVASLETGVLGSTNVSPLYRFERICLFPTYSTDTIQYRGS